MKIKVIAILLAVLICLTSIFALVSCGDKGSQGKDAESSGEADSAWAEAIYTADTELGTGAKTIKVEVVNGDKSVTFTIHTDAEKLDKALLENELVEGEDGAYGLYIKKANGMLADYDIDQTYWSFSIGGQMAMNGVSDETIADGAHYELTKEK